METRQEKLIDGSIYTINLDTQEMVNHFNNPQNCTNEILHQFNELSWYSNYLTKEDKVIIDLGGNIGLFALHVTPWAERIITVEPTPSHMALNRHITGKFSNVVHLEAAVSDKTGKVNFFAFDSNTTMNSLINRGGASFSVECITIPDLIEKYNLERVDFVKIDIEGSETIALNEQVIDFMSKRVSKILVEFHQVGRIGYSEQRSIFENLFTKYGYQTTHFGPDGLFCSK
jgi:FkbM family methyltransferase